MGALCTQHTRSRSAGSLSCLSLPLSAKKPETWPKSKLAGDRARRKGGRRRRRIKRLKGRKVFIILLFGRGRHALWLAPFVVRVSERSGKSQAEIKGDALRGLRSV